VGLDERVDVSSPVSVEILLGETVEVGDEAVGGTLPLGGVALVAVNVEGCD
jgi:hypothetical protein